MDDAEIEVPKKLKYQKGHHTVNRLNRKDVVYGQKVYRSDEPMMEQVSDPESKEHNWQI